MGVRKRERAEQLKEERKNLAVAKLNNCPTSPRKMRLVADLVRGKDVEHALNILKLMVKRLLVESRNFFYQQFQIGKLKMRMLV